MRKSTVYIGTSGWSYKHWKGTFYPDNITAAGQFGEYQRFFDTVELNNSFYKLPAPSAFAAWRKSSPPKFIFAVKGGRFLTHMKKLNVDKSSLDRFFDSANELKNKLGPILFQLPPRWRVNAERLRNFIKALPKGYRYAFEFREQTWYNDEVYTILKSANCAFCIYELDGHLSPIEVTATFVYIRLHGPQGKYQGSYSTQSLRSWARKIDSWQKKGLDVYLYFDNDEAGYAAFNALELKKIIDKKTTRSAAGQPRR